jgi:cytochrome P450 family 142 subfamily A polypeptide 1
MVRKMEEDFFGIVTDAIDAVAREGRCDFVDDIAVPLPLLIIADMIGVRPEDRARFHHWSDSMILAQGNLHERGVAERAGQAFVEYAQYCAEILEDRRRTPRDDLMSVLLSAKDDGVIGEVDQVERPGIVRTEEHRQLDNDELIMFCVLLLVAGNETTRNALSGGMKLLIEHPEARRRLVENPELIPGAVEEMLRLTSPVISFVRTATGDTELGGKKIAKGERILMLYPSANRDERVFPDAERFDIERSPQHLAFGIGNHFCLGANLARMELRVAFRELLRRTPDMSYTNGGPVMAPSALVRSFQHMEVTFSPEPVRASSSAAGGA